MIGLISWWKKAMFVFPFHYCGGDLGELWSNLRSQHIVVVVVVVGSTIFYRVFFIFRLNVGNVLWNIVSPTKYRYGS